MNDDAALDELLLRWEEQMERGQTPRVSALCADRPDLASALSQRIASLRQMEWVDRVQRRPH